MSADPQARQCGGQIGLLHEAVVQDHAEKSIAQVLDLRPLRLWHPRHLRGVDMQDQVALMHDVEMLGTVQHGHGDDIGATRQVNTRAFNLGFTRHGLDEDVQRHGLAFDLIDHGQASRAPSLHDQEQNRRRHQGHPTALFDLDQVRRHE